MLGQGGLLWFLEHLSPDRAPQPAVQAIRQFLREHTQSPLRLKHGGRLRPRLYVGRQRFPGFLGDEGRIAPDEYCLEIVSPFFENTADARTLIALLEAVNPVETRIYLPRDDDGTADAPRTLPGRAATGEGEQCPLGLSAERSDALERQGRQDQTPECPCQGLPLVQTWSSEGGLARRSSCRLRQSYLRGSHGQHYGQLRDGDSLWTWNASAAQIGG